MMRQHGHRSEIEKEMAQHQHNNNNNNNNNNGALIPPGGTELSAVLPTYAGGEESFVWFGLVLLAAKTNERNLTALITLLHLVVRMFLLNYQNENGSLPSTQYFRQQQQNSNNKRGDTAGMASSIVLVPVLLQSICNAAMHHHDDNNSSLMMKESMYVCGLQQLYALSMAVALPLVWQPYRFKWIFIPILVEAMFLYWKIYQTPPPTSGG